MKKEELYRYIGNVQQMASIRKVKYMQGQEKGLNAHQVKNGVLDFTVMDDRCMDIGEISYKGMQLNFLSKQGFQGTEIPNAWDELKSIMCGLFFTVGPDNIGGNFERDGSYYPLHGSFRLTPAQDVNAVSEWNQDDYNMSISGSVRKAALFGENIILRRKISTKAGSREILLEDELENEGFTKSAAMMLYHFNMGYPFLCEAGEIVLPSKKVCDRDDENYEKSDTWSKMSSPADGVPESVYLHELAADENGKTFAAYINPEMNIGFKLEFDQKILPYFTQWKSTASGDYVLGLEPANSYVQGRIYNEEQGTLPELEPFEKMKITIKIQILEGEEELKQIKEKARKLVEK